MRPSSSVHPRDEDEETPADPQPQSRKARKYIDRKAPKVDFLRKIFWSKKRRWLFFCFTCAIWLVNVAVIVNFSLHLVTHTMPATFRFVFLGYNFLYNTQAPGVLIGPGWFNQMLWRSWWFYVQALYSIRIMWVRAQNIIHHEKDIGTWLKKDWHMLYYKLGRFVFLVPTGIILLASVMTIKNPPIINSTFYQNCVQTPVYQLGLTSYQVLGTTVCNSTSQLSNLPLPETTYTGYIPDGGPPATAGSIMVSMRPVGTCVNCAVPSPDPVPYATFDTQSIRVCSSKSYQFSNWITTSDTCDALYYNNFYDKAYLTQNGYVQQWYCNTNMTRNSTHMTVFYDTVFGRISKATCQLGLDAPFLKAAPGIPGLIVGTEVSGVVANMTKAQLTVLTGRYLREYDECHDVSVSCLQNLDVNTNVASPYYRSIALFGCKRSFQASLTADTDQNDLDRWQSNWEYAYKLAAAGMAVETLWDYIEYAMYVFI